MNLSGADSCSNLITDTSPNVFGAESAVSHGFEYGACGNAHVGGKASDIADEVIGSFAYLSHGVICKFIKETS